MKKILRTFTILASFFCLARSNPVAAIRDSDSSTVKHNRAWSFHKHLFPPEFIYSSGFTTAADVFIPGVCPAPLDDKLLNVESVSNTTHKVVFEDGKIAWEAVYPEGSWNPSNKPLGGFGLYIGGSSDFASAVANGADEVMMGYSVMFQDGFEWNKGGKLPGIFGGDGSGAFRCSGGRQLDRSQCFDARLMWRTGGAGELYTYLPLTKENDAAQLAVPDTIVNPDYGYSVGRGLFTFPTGEWITIAQRVKLNTVGQNDGEIDLWINGEEVIKLVNIELRTDDGATIQGMHFQTFFGGSTSDWASPITQKAWFADVSGAVIQTCSPFNLFCNLSVPS